MRKMARLVARALGLGPVLFGWASGFLMSLAAELAAGLLGGSQFARSEPVWAIVAVLVLAGGSLLALAAEADRLRELEGQYSEAAQLPRDEIRYRAVTRDRWTQIRLTVLLFMAVFFTVCAALLLPRLKG